jgi:hypothetical protein
MGDAREQKYPGSHSPAGAVRPAVSQYDPGAHSAHAVTAAADDTLPNRPMGHGTGAGDEGGQYDPRGQGSGTGVPGGQNVPPPHATHAAATDTPPVALLKVPPGHGTCRGPVDRSGHTNPASHTPVGSTAPSTQ